MARYQGLYKNLNKKKELGYKNLGVNIKHKLEKLSSYTLQINRLNLRHF